MSNKITDLLYEFNTRADITIESLADLISDIAEPVKHGHWEGLSPMVDTLQCSECGYQILSEELMTPYCPWCGAKTDDSTMGQAKPSDRERREDGQTD